MPANGGGVVPEWHKEFAKSSQGVCEKEISPFFEVFLGATVALSPFGGPSGDIGPLLPDEMADESGKVGAVG